MAREKRDACRRLLHNYTEHLCGFALGAWIELVEVR